MPTRSEAKAKQERMEALAAEIDKLADAAADRGITYSQVEECLSALHALGKFPPDFLVFAIPQAFGTRA
jgi:hypothetical protein